MSDQKSDSSNSLLSQRDIAKGLFEAFKLPALFLVNPIGLLKSPPHLNWKTCLIAQAALAIVGTLLGYVLLDLKMIAPFQGAEYAYMAELSINMVFQALNGCIMSVFWIYILSLAVAAALKFYPDFRLSRENEEAEETDDVDLLPSYRMGMVATLPFLLSQPLAYVVPAVRLLAFLSVAALLYCYVKRERAVSPAANP